MRLDTGVLDLLRCPACGGMLGAEIRESASDGHVVAGTLTCAGCGAAYPIVRGVPRLMTGTLAAHVASTVDAFGYQWTHGNAVLRDARFSAPEVFLDFIQPVQAEWFRGKIVLDAGCGTGRFTLNSARFGARCVIGVDLSSSVDVAFDNTRHLPNVVIVQADILNLPLAAPQRDGQRSREARLARGIDYAFSVAVLHHTADPRGAFLHIASKVVPGGSMSAWVYGREHNGWIVHLVNPIRTVTSRLPRPALLAAAHLLAIPITVAVKAIYAPVARRPALHWMKRGLFYFDYMAFLGQFGYREHAYIVFDHAVPAIAEYIRREDFAAWFAAAHLEQVTITMRGGNSWRGFGVVRS